MSAVERAMTIWRRAAPLMPRVGAHALALVALALLAAPASAAQSGFEAATIKPGHDCYVGKMPIHTSPGRIDFSCITVRTLIAMAYGVSSQRDLVSSPRRRVSGGAAWLDSNRYDISAKAERPAPLVDMLGPMLQRLLTERLNLRVHTEFREGPVYDLIKGRNPKLKATVVGSCKVVDPNEVLALRKTGPNESGSQFCGSHVLSKGPGAIATTLEAQSVTMEQFANRILPQYVDRPVVDKTGLQGPYDFRLEFTRDRSGTATLNGAFQQPDLTSSQEHPENLGPSIYTSIEKQLGLKLVASKGSLKVIIVDSVDKPSAD